MSHPIEDYQNFKDAMDAIERVRELHIKEKDNPNAEWCQECFAKYPCPTIKALDGDPS